MQPSARNHYEIARDAALARLLERMDAGRLRQLGAEVIGGGATILLPVLCWTFRVRMGPFSMTLEPEGQQVHLPWQILTLDYLAAPEPRPPTGFVSFADLAEARVYESTFRKRVADRLSAGVGRTRESFARAAEQLGAFPAGHPTTHCVFRFFPLVEFEVVLHPGSEELAGTCNVLLSDNVVGIFSVEDAVVAAERLVSALEGRSPAASGAGARKQTP